VVLAISSVPSVPLVVTSGERHGNDSRSAGPSFTSWADVSRFQTEVSEPQQTTTDAISEKTRSLVSNGATELERIAAVGRYVQNIKYIAISTRLGRGGGYRPHPAVDVFTKSYGDCKDKANLMRTMLKIEDTA
jgi:transglutaminase-like putative cysteine protease